MNLKKSILGLTLAAGLCFAGTANAADLYVSGAASLTNAFEAVKAAFVKKNPGPRRQCPHQLRSLQPAAQADAGRGSCGRVRQR